MSIGCLYDIDCVSSINYISDDKYFIKSKFMLEYRELMLLSELKNKLSNVGAIYGEINNNDYDVSLSHVSHCIRHIDSDIALLRKSKLKKLNNEQFDNLYNTITIEILNTHQGKLIKSIMDSDININIRTVLRCIKNDNNDTIKIFTVNIKN